jgi:hypothetical protein
VVDDDVEHDIIRMLDSARATLPESFTVSRSLVDRFNAELVAIGTLQIGSVIGGLVEAIMDLERRIVELDDGGVKDPAGEG